MGAETKAHLRGDIAVLWASYIDFTAGHLERALAGRPTGRRPPRCRADRSLSHALVLQMVVLALAGRMQEAHALAEQTMGDPRLAATHWAPAAWGMPYVGWIQADMHLIDRYAPTLITDGERWGLPDSLAAGHYFLGTSAYHTGPSWTTRSPISARCSNTASSWRRQSSSTPPSPSPTPNWRRATWTGPAAAPS